MIVNSSFQRAALLLHYINSIRQLAVVITANLLLTSRQWPSTRWCTRFASMFSLCLAWSKMSDSRMFWIYNRACFGMRFVHIFVLGAHYYRYFWISGCTGRCKQNVLNFWTIQDLPETMAVVMVVVVGIVRWKKVSVRTGKDVGNFFDFFFIFKHLNHAKNGDKMYEAM